ncbi:hypothetical protein RF11_08259 [Thelohanellus kitauei]|uniref:Uncharacterized protein n=1 Tax=Thelohanellus kitauei TaxID=669202 RepID=A0A0C2N0Q1_THEKT|nr:hypothetical protein RF11_08259 [Thelohanellus kitauei]
MDRNLISSDGLNLENLIDIDHPKLSNIMKEMNKRWEMELRSKSVDKLGQGRIFSWNQMIFSVDQQPNIIVVSTIHRKRNMFVCLRSSSLPAYFEPCQNARYKPNSSPACNIGLHRMRIQFSRIAQ